MKPAPSAPALEPNTCFMGTGESYGKGLPSAPPLSHLQGFTPGWSYTDYAKRTSQIVPVELSTAPPGKPVKKKLDSQCRVGHHISWLMQLGAIAALIAAPFFDWYIAIASGALVALYLLENGCSSTSSYLQNFMLQNEAQQFIQKLRETSPTIQFKIQCYHYETRTREVEDSDGNTRTETWTERVDTHWASESYDYDVYKDYTKFPPFSFAVMKMALKEFHCFEDPYTESHFEEKKRNFIWRNNRDTYYDFWVARSIPGMKNRVLVETQPGAMSSFWTCGWFCCSVITCWAPCYRMWFLKYTGKEYVRVTKSVQKLPPGWYRRNLPGAV